MPGVDILDQRDPIGKPFAGSLLFHGSLLVFVIAAPYIAPKPILLGDPNPMPGAIGVTMVKTIPIPRAEGPLNRLANDTKSIVPEPPEPKVTPKPVIKEKLPPPDAIQIPKHEKPKPKKPEKMARTTPQFKADRLPEPNQVYSSTPQRMSAPEYQIQGTNGVGVGKTNNPFGDQFGWYAQLIQDRISRKWNRADLSRSRNRAIVRFTLMSDGSVQNVQLVQSSGSSPLDTSAQRALLDAAPLPPLPKALNRNSVVLDLEFELLQ
jgi:TonB family protein